MGIYDRDYYRSAPPRAGFGVFSFFSVTTWLIIVNIAVFLLDMITHNLAVQRTLGAHYDDPYARHFAHTLVARPLQTWGAFSMTDAIYHFQFWRFITFQFLHADAVHLFSNMLALFLFGPVVEYHFGAARYVAFYLLCGLAGAALYMILNAAHVLIGSPDAQLVGASAGIFGVLVGAAMIAPDVEVWLFTPFPMQIKYLAMIMMAIAVMTIFRNGLNAGGEAAHVGGGLLGFVFIKNQQLLDPFHIRRRTTGVGRKVRRRVRFKDWSKDMNH